MVTVGQLRQWRPDALAALAADLHRQATELDALAQRLGSVTGAQLHAAWDGFAATEAHRHGAQKQAQLVEFANQVAAGATALSTAAAAIAEAQAMLGRGAKVAADAGLQMGETGTVLPSPRDDLMNLALAGIAPADIALIRSSHREAIQQATLLTQAALAAAEETDRDAARAISALPSLTTSLVASAGFGIGAFLAGDELRALLLAGMLQGITLRDLPPAGADPRQVAMWWAGLSPEQQRLQIRANPDSVGMLDGLPVSARHAANQLVLNRERAASNADVARLQADLARATAEAAAHPPRYAGRGVPNSAQINTVLLQRRLDEAIRHRAMLAAVQAQLDADPSRTLLLLDPAGEGRAAIALGPIDTARHVAVVVPGLEQDVRQDMGRIVSNAERLKLTADRLALKASNGEEVATVAWIGYDTPNYTQVGLTGHAERGAVHLRDTLGGLDAAREAARIGASATERPEPMHLTVVGHSYGSLTTGIAVREPLPVDEVVFIGSPGVGAYSADELAIPQAHVFVGENRGDPVADFQHFGMDPNADGFGAREFQTDGGIDPLTNSILREARGHSQHFDVGTESVRNLALIALGRDDLVTYGEMGSSGDGVAGVLLGVQGDAVANLLGKDLR
jgi:hypothetical protein